MARLTSTSFPESLKPDVKAMCKHMDITVSQLINQLVKQRLKSFKKAQEVIKHG